MGLFVWVLLRLALDLDATLTPPPVLRDVAVPASSFVGGVEGLSAGKILHLTVFVPNAQSTPEAALQTAGEVRDTLGADRTAALLAVPAAAAPTLEAALLNAGTKLTYHSLSDWPTATPLPTPAPTLTPTATLAPGETPTITPTPTPQKGKLYWTLSLERNRAPLDGFMPGMPARLVILAQLPTNNDTETITPPTAFAACAIVMAFQDATGQLVTTDVPADAVAVVLQISATDLPDLLLNLKYASDIYLAADQSCAEA